MKRFKWDAFEFDSPDREEEFELVISSPRGRPHATLTEFVRDAVGKDAARTLPAPVAFSKFTSFRRDVALLGKFGDLQIPEDCAWPCFVLADEWDYRHCVLDAGEAFMAYSWSTSA